MQSFQDIADQNLGRDATKGAPGSSAELKKLSDQASYFGSPFQQLDLLRNPAVDKSLTGTDRLRLFGAGAFNAVASPEQKLAVGGVGDAVVGKVRQLSDDVVKAGAPPVSSLNMDTKNMAASPDTLRASKGEPSGNMRRFYRPGMGKGIQQERVQGPSPFGRIGRP